MLKRVRSLELVKEQPWWCGLKIVEKLVKIVVLWEQKNLSDFSRMLTTILLIEIINSYIFTSSDTSLIFTRFDFLPTANNLYSVSIFYFSFYDASARHTATLPLPLRIKPSQPPSLTTTPNQAALNPLLNPVQK